MSPFAAALTDAADLRSARAILAHPAGETDTRIAAACRVIMARSRDLEAAKDAARMLERLDRDMIDSWEGKAA